MTRTNLASKAMTKGLGSAIKSAKGRQLEKMRMQAEAVSQQIGIGHARGGSVLEQTDLADLISTIEMKKEAWAEDVGEAEYVTEGPSLIVAGEGRVQAEKEASERRELVSIPRRPVWHDGMSVEELTELEYEAFVQWRQDLQKISAEQGLYLTPYERNLDFWRQLWRCMERSDLLVQIVDARDPDFYICRDIIRYVEELGGDKKCMVIVNKADFLTEAQRVAWIQYFQSRGIDHLFFSGLRELRRQVKENVAQPRPRISSRISEEAEEDSEEEEEDRAAAPASQSVFARARREDSDSDAEGEADVAASSKASTAAPAGTRGARSGGAKVLDGVDVPVPGLSDSDEDLREDEDSEGEDEEVLGPSADAELPGVLDAQMLIEELCKRVPYRDEFFPDEASTAATSRRRGTIGFVGYPNVGKSTVINAICGKTRVGMSRTPGKTKHIQTLELQDLGITLCDCPGLVFPSVAATKSHLVINNTVHIDDLRECFAPIDLIVEKVGWENVLAKYDCKQAVANARARSGDHVLDNTHAFLAALAVSRHHLLRAGVPDENWAARKVLKDYVLGSLLHCEAPPGTPSDDPAFSNAFRGPVAAAQDAAAAAPAAVVEASEASAATATETEGGEEDEFSDLGAFLQEAGGARGGKMTKRRMRQMNKKMQRGKEVLEAADFVGAHMAPCFRGSGGRR